MNRGKFLLRIRLIQKGRRDAGYNFCNFVLEQVDDGQRAQTAGIKKD